MLGLVSVPAGVLEGVSVEAAAVAGQAAARTMVQSAVPGPATATVVLRAKLVLLKFSVLLVDAATWVVFAEISLLAAAVTTPTSAISTAGN